MTPATDTKAARALPSYERHQGDIMLNHADQIGSAVLAADAASQTQVIVAIAVAAVGGLTTIAVGLLNIRMQRQGLQWQKAQHASQLKLMESAHITDGFTDAINQLGSDNKAVRIGGVFALERIARDSQQDRPNIASTLAAFIRESQPAATVQAQSYVPMLKLRAPDVQAAMTVLCRSPLCNERLNTNGNDLLDLSRTDLRRASLQGAHLERVNLGGARLEGANLRGAHLQGTVLSRANLGQVDPQSLEYQFGADLSDADLTGAELFGVIGLHVVKTTDGTRGLPM